MNKEMHIYLPLNIRSVVSRSEAAENRSDWIKKCILNVFL
jgi:hypothetical protein